MSTAVLVQQVLHILEEFEVATLVGGDGDALHVLFDSTFHNIGYRPVMSQVNDLGSF